MHLLVAAISTYRPSKRRAAHGPSGLGLSISPASASARLTHHSTNAAVDSPRAAAACSSAERCKSETRIPIAKLSRQSDIDRDITAVFVFANFIIDYSILDQVIGINAASDDLASVQKKIWSSAGSF
jgi:hypothetical protein